MIRQTAVVLLCALGVASQTPQFPTCSSTDRTCPAGLECDIVAQRCYHHPRQLGEACGIGRDCAKDDLNTTHAMECSTWCGVCIIKDQADALEKPAKSAAELERERHMEMLHTTRKRCGVTSNATYVNFEETLITNMPIVYPKTDSELEQTLLTLAANGCKARPVGATHTSSSVITSEAEEDTIGISLAEYHPDDKAWDLVLHQDNSTVKIPAGRSLYDLYEAIRPYGFFLPTQTAGPIFTMGGIVTNTVHGGVFNTGFVSEYVKSMTVMYYANSNVVRRTITEESELRYWRNSYGLLGIITAVEFTVVKRSGFQVASARKSFSKNFTREAVDQYFNDLTKDHIYSESFFNPFEVSINSVLFSTGDVPDQCFDISDKSCEWNYGKAHCDNEDCCHYSYKFGDITLGESCRAKYAQQRTTDEYKQEYAKISGAMQGIPYHGAPDLSPAMNSDLCLLEWITAQKAGPLEPLLATAFYDTCFSTIDSQVATNRADVNDGFYLRKVPHAIKLIAYFVPRANLFDMLNIVKEVFESVKSETGETAVGNAEFRFLNITDKAVLFPTGAVTGKAHTGQYVNCEVVFNAHPGMDPILWSSALYGYEQKMRALDGFLHTGKSFCYGNEANNTHTPYANTTCVKTIFNDEQKATFNAYRNKTDPKGLFAGGAALEFF